MSKSSTILAFSLGAAAGAVVSWRLLKRYYDNLVSEEIKSFKETYKKQHTHTYEGPNDADEAKKQEQEQDVETVNESDMDEYTTTLVENGYTNEITEQTDSKPFVIPPEDFGEDEDFETESLTYYADGVLTDDFDNPIEDIDGLIGKDALTTFGRYEDDSVFVRNIKHRTDYEILKDERKYSDVIAQRGS